MLGTATAPRAPSSVFRPLARTCSATTLRFFAGWTAVFWGGVGVCAALFFVGVLDFATSAKAGLYAVSVWLNACLLVFALPANRERPRLAVYHDALVVWMLSYFMTNALWEIPWVLASPFVFDGLHTLDDVVAWTDWMRESPLHMTWWMLASFSAVDLRTVNHDPTFYTLELYAFVNVATVLWFFKLNRERSPFRYLIPVLGAGEPVAATFIFSGSEVFSGFANMPGGTADTLLALVWTQYQYLLFPLVFGALSCRLLLDDWRRAPHLYPEVDDT
ncbi:MAG: hypothetical protein EP330_13005 [Deltaproteobacteria bacterium]|nr:MAG: hypothetical protein EP330_13005 [Deltaproteobacteria bacterium]